MNYTVTYYDDAVQAAIMAMPVTLQARYICLTKRMAIYGANLIPKPLEEGCSSCD